LNAGMATLDALLLKAVALMCCHSCFCPSEQGSWDVFGLVLKALKLQSKHEACAVALMRVGCGEVSRMLLAVSRLLARLPQQQRLLKVCEAWGKARQGRAWLHLWL
jgi:hypothetical protein